MNINIFNNDEKVVINALFNGEIIEIFSKEACVKDIEFVIETHQDEQILLLYKKLKEKILQITEEDWKALKEAIPFKLEYDNLEILE